jgi:hypothetical protein
LPGQVIAQRIPAQGENNFLTHFSSLIILDCV